jgi:hypothetical protein
MALWGAYFIQEAESAFNPPKRPSVGYVLMDGL